MKLEGPAPNEWKSSSAISWAWLTLSVLKPEYSRRNKTMPFLLMPWLHRLPSHQQPRHCLCRINRFLSLMSKDVKYLHRLSFENWWCILKNAHTDGLVQDCSILSAVAIEILQPWTKPSINLFVSWNKFSLTRVKCFDGQHSFVRSATRYQSFPCIMAGVDGGKWAAVDKLQV